MAIFRNWRQRSDRDPAEQRGDAPSPPHKTRIEPLPVPERHGTIIDARGGIDGQAGTDAQGEDADMRLTMVELPVDQGPAYDPRPPNTMLEAARMSIEQPATEPYQVVFRKPTPLLVILDDGKETGEVVRLRQLPTTIGRARADVEIPHDSQVSPQHVRIAWAEPPAAKTPALMLEDLNSETGTFVKVMDAAWRVDRQLRLGATRLGFTSPDTVWIEAPDGVRRETKLNAPSLLVGRDASTCQIVVDDPMVDAQHVKLEKKASNGWRIEDLKSLNGTWLQVKQIRISEPAEFLLGEQRFCIRPRG